MIKTKSILLTIAAIIVLLVVIYNSNVLEGFSGDKRSEKEKETIMIVFTSVFGAIALGVAFMAFSNPLTIESKYSKLQGSDKPPDPSQSYYNRAKEALDSFTSFFKRQR